MAKGFSGPKAFPFIGNLYLLLGDMEDIYFRDVTNKMLKLSNKYASPWRFWINPKLFILFDDPKCIEIYYEKNLIYDLFKPAVGNGLFTIPALKWEIHRKILNPVFKEQFHSTFMDSISKNSNSLATILESTDGKNIDTLHCIHLCTLDIIYDSFLGRDLDLQNNPECKLDEYIIMDIAFQRIVKVWLHPNIIFNYSSTGKRLKKLLSHINKITNEI
ncbi:cytochrome P450 4C1-like [Polistes fuscatus]|uniref:cytochrome P450 4C1-like n=1 Tax=Polistes fuscatus TaxID=30207 RepID=UPI001CA86502|nr:cytochrome P450 4C1-like [Polistes fuscatus]